MFHLISWNVNGFRAVQNKGFQEFFFKEDADIYCFQETKMQDNQTDFSPPGYEMYFNSAEKKGYSGTAIFSKMKPLRCSYGIGIKAHDQEGRVLTAEYETFFLVNVYTPNSKRELLRLSYRLEWEEDFRQYLMFLDQIKPVIVCGDMNVAHEEIDLKNPKTNRKNAGFTDEERGKFEKLLNAGFVDSFRFLYPDKTGAYTWWSYMRDARKTNAGWRIDYFLVSQRIKDLIHDAVIMDEVLGSDHCPIGLYIDL